ncbi:MAG: hypothetical protein Q9190_001632 [Brigantiaea leucoxantha]
MLASVLFVSAATVIVDNTTTTIVNPEPTNDFVRVFIQSRPADLPIDILQYQLLTAVVVCRIALKEIPDPIVQQLELDLQFPITLTVRASRSLGFHGAVSRKVVLDGLVLTANQFTRLHWRFPREFSSQIYVNGALVGTIFIAQRVHQDTIDSVEAAQPNNSSTVVTSPGLTQRRRWWRRRRQALNIASDNKDDDGGSQLSSHLSVDNTTIQRASPSIFVPEGFLGHYNFNGPSLPITEIFTMVINSARTVYLHPLDTTLRSITFGNPRIPVMARFSNPPGGNRPTLTLRITVWSFEHMAMTQYRERRQSSFDANWSYRRIAVAVARIEPYSSSPHVQTE